MILFIVTAVNVDSHKIALWGPFSAYDGAYAYRDAKQQKLGGGWEVEVASLPLRLMEPKL